AAYRRAGGRVRAVARPAPNRARVADRRGGDYSGAPLRYRARLDAEHAGRATEKDRGPGGGLRHDDPARALGEHRRDGRGARAGDVAWTERAQHSGRGEDAAPARNLRRQCAGYRSEWAT